MLRFRTQVLLSLTLAFSLGQMVSALAGDADKPIVPAAGSEKTPFPLPVKLLGYITKNGVSIALVDINGQILTLRQGDKKPFRLNGMDKPVVVWFETPIDTENRKLVLGFPNSFDYVECRLGVEVPGSDR